MNFILHQTSEVEMTSLHLALCYLALSKIHVLAGS